MTALKKRGGRGGIAALPCFQGDAGCAAGTLTTGLCSNAPAAGFTSASLPATDTTKVLWPPFRESVSLGG